MKQLLDILHEIRPDVDFAKEKNLINSGILDSFDVIALVGELNNTYNINIGVEHLLPKNFDSVEAIMNLIGKVD